MMLKFITGFLTGALTILSVIGMCIYAATYWSDEETFETLHSMIKSARKHR